MNRYKWKWKALDRYEEWKNIPPKKRRRIIICSLLALLILCFGIRHLILHRYDSTGKLEAIYLTNKETLHSVVESLTSLPAHPDAPDAVYEDATFIIFDGDWDPIGSPFAVCQKQKEIWICSAKPYTEKEYQMIYDTVMPLFQQTRLRNIVISPDRRFVDFEVSVNSSCLDCIFYYDGSPSLDTNDYLEHYSRSIHYHYAHFDSSVAKDIKLIDDCWYVATAAYYF